MLEALRSSSEFISAMKLLGGLIVCALCSYVSGGLNFEGPLISVVVIFGVPLCIVGGRHRPLNYRSFEVITMRLANLPPHKDGDVNAI